MSLAVPHPPGDRKRVKVYELRNNDWFDRGTGFCTGQIVDDEPRIYVESEEQPERMLLETRVGRDDGYQKQQDTLIVWTEQPHGTDMALSFQEAEGCAAIWDFVSHVQQQLIALAGPDDALSEDAIDSLPNPIMLPAPELGNLPDIEQVVRAASSTPQGRDSLSKFVLGEDYIAKLLPLVSTAEDLESLPDLHRMCNIMKSLILLNDTAIMERVVTDEVILGVVGALEYDPDFPNHKANHRHYLTNRSKFKEVVQIQDEGIRKKIHHTYRLQYLKDVVLARILDDPTFSVLNSLIFYNQVDIVQHLQANVTFIRELFLVFEPQEQNPQRKKDGVLFIQQCCAIAKNIQAPARAQLYNHFIQHDVFKVITFALAHQDPSVRIAGTDVLVALIDHDPAMMRSLIFKQISDKSVPLTDTLIELLLREVDFGVKAQMADAIKVLLDPTSNNSTVEAFAKASTEFMSRVRGNTPGNPQTETFIQHFYEDSAKKLFQPLMDLQHRESVQNLTSMEVALFSHLVEILNFFVRQHLFRSKLFILANSLASRVGQLVACPEKHLKLTALKFFRACIGMQDEFYNRQIMQDHLIGPIVDVVYETMPRNNLLNSACLEFFEFIKRENIKALIVHVVENYRDKIKDITYVDTFQNLVLRYDQMQDYHNNPEGEQSVISQEEESSTSSVNRTPVNGGRRWQGVREMDAAEEEYFNTSDDEEETSAAALTPTTSSSSTTTNRSSETAQNGGSTPVRPLVDYPDDDEENDKDDVTTTSSSSSSTSSTAAVGSAGAGTVAARRTVTVVRSSDVSAGDRARGWLGWESGTLYAPPRRRPQTALSGNADSTTTTTIGGQTDGASHSQQAPPAQIPTPSPPERLSEKRRREEDEADEDDELGKLSITSSSKRRSSSMSSSSSSTGGVGGSGEVLRRKKSFQSSGGGSSSPTRGSINTGHGFGGGGGGGLKDVGKSRGTRFSGGGGAGGISQTTTTATSMTGGRKIAISLAIGKGGSGGHSPGATTVTTTTTTTKNEENNNDDDDKHIISIPSSSSSSSSIEAKTEMKEEEKDNIQAEHEHELDSGGGGRDGGGSDNTAVVAAATAASNS